MFDMKTMAVLLCTFNGEKFLGEQLRTLAEQTVKDLVVFVSDDGSTDNTLRIIEENKNKYPHLNIQFLDSSLRDSREGFQYNFLSIFNLPVAPAKYIAFCDQDDLWEKDKLETAVNYLQNLPEDQPGLYGGRTQLIDENDHKLGFSALFTKKPSFANAMVQSIMGGNTMVLNKSAWHLMKKASGPKIITHDWWIYLVISGAGGHVFYDAIPRIQYRQHINNIVGNNSTLVGRLSRLKWLLQGRFSTYNQAHVTALFAIKHLLTSAHQNILNHFADAQKTGFIGRLRYLLCKETYRQTFLDNLGLSVAILIGKF